MDWFRTVNSYCERTDASFWSEPVNALTNLAFVAAAVVCWRMGRQAGDRLARTLALIVAAIGGGSFLFHTVARVWAMLADVIPIQIFILVYLYAATVRFVGAPVWVGLLAAIAFVPLSGALSAAIGAVTGPLNGSVGYLPVPILVLAYAAALARRKPETARGLAIGGALLGLSLVFRTVDGAVCAGLPLGTHFLWHLLNAGMLAWMVRVLVRATPPRSAAEPVKDANP